MMSITGLKEKILAEMEERGFPKTAVVQNKVEDTGLDKFADAIASAVVEYIQQNAQAIIPPGTVLVAAQAGVPNPSSISLTIT